MLQPSSAAPRCFSICRSTHRFLVVAGTEDHIYPPSKSVQIAELIPGAELQMMERTGHVLAIENPTAVNELLEEHLGGL